MATKKRARKGKAMSETQDAELLKQKVDVKNDSILTIEGIADNSGVRIYLRAPKVAEIIRKMQPANYPKADIDKIYAPILQPYPLPEGATDKQIAMVKAQTHIITRPAVGRVTKNFEAGTDFDFERPPRAILLYNADALEAGFYIEKKLEKPVPPDVLRRWGKQVIDGIADIVQNARPFRMTWTMTETPKVG